ncbi:glycosyltransferase family 39 protein [bacterium]|nr:glycosyltransferase family 39 protein [bacterium]
MPSRDRTYRLAVIALAALALGLRFYRIDAPLTDHHYWRQVDTAAMARNFAEGNLNILHPMLDWQGPHGYAEVEFQLYTWLVAVIYRWVGVHEVWGRLVSVAFSMAGLWLLFDLARRALSREAGLGALALGATAPLAVFFGRSFQPESAMASFSMLAIYGAWRHSEEGGLRWFWVSALATSLAILLKLPSLYLGLPLLVLAWWREGGRFLLRPRWWAFAAIALVPAALWYPWAHELGKESAAGFSILTGSGTHELFPVGLYGTAQFWLMLGRRWAIDGLAVLGVPLALVGAWRLRAARFGWLWAWLGAFLLYQPAAALGHGTHDYYSLPLWCWRHAALRRRS